MSTSRKTLCVDFDGVLHSYESGWKGADVVADPPVPGALEWLAEMVQHYDVCIYSSRSKHPGGIEAMRQWLDTHGASAEVCDRLRFPTEKPAAYLTIDDRAICFEGTFPSVLQIESFRPWNRRK